TRRAVSAALAQREIDPSNTQGRNERAREGDERGYDEREEDGDRVDPNVVQSWNPSGTRGHQRSGRHRRAKESEHGGQRDEGRGFGEEVHDQATAAGAESGANRKLSLMRFSPNER